MLNTITGKIQPVASRVEPRRSSFSRLGWTLILTVLPFLTTVPLALAEGPQISNYLTKTNLQIAQDVAPYVFFHDLEHNWPVTIETFLAQSSLYRTSTKEYLGPVGNEANLFALLKAKNLGDGADTYLKAASSIYGGSKDPSTWRPYVRVIDHTNRTYFNANNSLFWLPPNKEVQFWFFFAYNGCQTHRMNAWNPALPWDDYTRHFQMCDAARHEGDVEAITVYINSLTHRPMGVSTTRHGDVIYTPWEDLSTDGLRARIWSAWASHAMYSKKGRVVLSDDMTPLAVPICGLLNVTYWKLMDLADGGDKVWNAGAYKNNLVLLQDKDTTKSITGYRGRWGLMGLNNRQVHQPSAQGQDSNMGKDVMPYVSDEQIKWCFDNVILGGTIALWDFTSWLGQNPIYGFGPEGLDEKKLIGNGTDWFSNTAWCSGMPIEKVGQ
jgi:hypothetical protein